MKTFFTRLLCLAFVLGLLNSSAHAVVLPARPASTEPDAATVQSALAAFKNMSRKERKEKMREVKIAVKDYKTQNREKAAPVASTLLQVIFAILIPPLGVYLHEGEINKRFWIDLLLTILFFVPGLIYALVVVLGTK
jgi:uncharacterized membrane protein YqaE (UPF0057 family)